tara:strand:- start:57 stop:635 length:579 start_codon:yes stop_codon:yes gene_type:complete
MANASTTGFGLKPIKMVGQSDENMGLAEFPVAASSSAIYFQDMVAMAATGYAAVAAAATTHNLGSLNGVFYTDTTSLKPTFKNYLPGSITATDIQALVNSNPLQMYEVRSNNAGASAQTDVGNSAEISYAVGVTPNWISRTTLDDSTLNNSTSQQLKIIGLSRDPDNNEIGAAGVVWRVIIMENFALAVTAV